MMRPALHPSLRGWLRPGFSWIGNLGFAFLVAMGRQFGWQHLKPRTHWTDCTILTHTKTVDRDSWIYQEGTCKEGTVTLDLNVSKQMERVPW